MSMVEASFVEFFVAKRAEMLHLSSSRERKHFLFPFPEKILVLDGLPVIGTAAAM
jgi:hypothetical protein